MQATSQTNIAITLSAKMKQASESIVTKAWQVITSKHVQSPKLKLVYRIDQVLSLTVGSSMELFALVDKQAIYFDDVGNLDKQLGTFWNFSPRKWDF